MVLSQDYTLYSFDDLSDSRNLSWCGGITLKTVLIFPKNFLDFGLDTIEKQGFKTYIDVRVMPLYTQVFPTLLIL